MDKETLDLRKKLLFISDSIMLGTGYANQAAGILNGLKEDYDCYNLGFQYHGNPIKINGITILPNGYDPWGNDIIPMHIKNLKPDIVMTLMDHFRPAPWLKDGTLQKYGAKHIAYFPLDARPIPLNAEDAFKTADKYVAMAKFGQKLLKDELGIDCEMIYHGTDPNLFRPRDDTYQAPSLLKDKFVIGSVFRNCNRKNPSALIFAFQRFLKELKEEDRKDVRLYLHCDPSDRMGMNLGALIHKLKIQNYVVFTGIHSIFYSLSYEQLAKTYQAMDLFALSTSGEGFGIPYIEAMATGLPVVSTNYTTSAELIGGDIALGDKFDETLKVNRGHLIKCWFYPTQCAHLTERAFIDYKDLAKVFHIYYEFWLDKSIKKRYAHSRDYVIEKHDWNTVIIPQWKKLIQEVLDGK